MCYGVMCGGVCVCVLVEVLVMHPFVRSAVAHPETEAFGSRCATLRVFTGVHQKDDQQGAYARECAAQKTQAPSFSDLKVT